MGMIMHDDVPYGEGTSYTQGTGIAINNNVIAVDADNTPTAESEKPVKSKGVYEVVEQIYADNGVLGAKNLLPQAEHANTTMTINGVTITSREDGSVLLNGTSTAPVAYHFIRLSSDANRKFIKQVAGKKVTISGTNVLNTGAKVQFWSSVTDVIADTTGKGTTFIIPSDLATTGDYNFAIYIPSRVTVNNVIVYPMLRLASDPDDTYVPYAMTNKELTEAIDEFTSSVSPVNSVVTFPDLNPDYGYDLYVDIPDETSSLPTNLTDLPVCKWTKVQRSTKADGTITLAYTVTNVNVNYCLRILK